MSHYFSWNIILLQVTCVIPKSAQQKLLRMAGKVEKLLAAQGIAHFLCYGSLWGQLKQGAIFSWSRKVTLCAINEQLKRLDEVFLRNTFRSRGLLLEYDHAEGIMFVRELEESRG